MLDKVKNFIINRSEWFVGLVCYIVYIFTTAPSVVQIDSGELAAVQSTLGIAHPTGYPIFSVIGYLLLKIPLPFTQIYKANLLAALWCSLGVLFFVKSIQILISELISESFTSKKSKSKKLTIVQQPILTKTIQITLPSIIGGFFLAFNKTFWMQSTSVEVYSLQIFLFTLIIYFTLLAYFSSADSFKKWFVVTVMFGLGFSNHMTTFLLLPFAVILYFLKEGITKRSIKRIFILTSAIIGTILLTYSYLPLRALSNPEINWGNPINFENLFRHISGKQYQVWLFSSIEAAKKQLIYYLENLPSEFAYVGFLLAILGLLELYRKSIKIFWSCIITYSFSVLYSINYDISDIDSYFLVSYILFATFISFGSITIFRKVKTISQPLKKIITVFILIAIPGLVNFNKVNQSRQHFFEDYTKEILSSVEQNAIIFSYQWDYFISPSYYFQFVENYRKDVVIIDKELLRRSWYYNQIERNYPDVLKGLKPEIKNFLVALKPFERDEQFDPTLIEKYYREIMKKLISENSNRPFYIGFELVQNEMNKGEFNLPEGYKIIPHKYLFKVVNNDNYVPLTSVDINIRTNGPTNKYTDNIIGFVSNMYINRVYYELSFFKRNEIKSLIDAVRKFNPEIILPENLIRAIQ
jgi:hypothetical protein